MEELTESNLLMNKKIKLGISGCFQKTGYSEFLYIDFAFSSKKTPTSKVGDELRLLLT